MKTLWQLAVASLSQLWQHLTRGSQTKSQTTSPAPHRLVQLRVLGFGFLQDGDVGVGVFPEGRNNSLRQSHPAQQVGVAGVGAKPVKPGV